MQFTRNVTLLEHERRPSWGRLNRQRLQAALNVPGPRLLDLGCAGGAYVETLRARGYMTFGLDLLTFSEWRTAPRKVLVQAGLPHLPFPDQAFDSVLAFEILEHIPDSGVGLQEIRRVCRSGLLLSVPDCAQVDDLANAGLAYSHYLDHSHCNFFEETSLRRLLEENGFQVESLQRINPVLVDYPALRSWRMPRSLAHSLARLLAHLPGRRRYPMTLLVFARRRP